MRILIFLMILSQIFSCKTSKLVGGYEIIGENHEPGKCYFSLMVESDIDIIDASSKRIERRKEDQFVLKVIPPKYKEI